MSVLAPKEIPGISAQETGEFGTTIDKPTSPEQIHDKTVLDITTSLQAAGLPITTESVKVHQVFQPTTDSKKVGMEPSGIDLSPKNTVRLITEELEPADVRNRVVVGEGSLGVGMNKEKQRRSKMSGVLDKLRFKKVA